jgi:hypothetical protein
MMYLLAYTGMVENKPQSTTASKNTSLRNEHIDIYNDKCSLSEADKNVRLKQEGVP